jgi:tetratricopeptide (TPR) repeat protein
MDIFDNFSNLFSSKNDSFLDKKIKDLEDRLFSTKNRSRVVSSSGIDDFKTAIKNLHDSRFNKDGFYISIKQNDTSWIHKRKKQIFDSYDASLKSGYGVVCVYENKLNLAQKSFDQIPGTASSKMESKGIISYELGKYDDAISFLKNNAKTKYGKLVHSLSLLKNDDTSLASHFKILNDVDSDLAKRILGTLAYNNENYEVARAQFSKAWKINKSELNLLNVLAAERRLERNYSNKEFTTVASKYFMDAKDIPSIAQIDNYLYRSSIEIPSFKLGKNMYKVLMTINK